MVRNALTLLGPVTLLTGCHPPDQRAFDEAKACVGIFEVGLGRIPSYQFRRAGLTYIDVDQAGVDAYGTALKFGANTGRSKKTIIKEVGEAKQRARATYGTERAPSPEAPPPRLMAAVKACMPRPDGPND